MKSNKETENLNMQRNGVLASCQKELRAIKNVHLYYLWTYATYNDNT